MNADPTSRARALIRRAQQYGKPLRIFLGYRAVGGGRYELVAYDDAGNLRKTMPRAEIEVRGDDDIAALAALLGERWAALEAQRIAEACRPSCAPKRTHQWFHGDNRIGRKRGGTPA